MKNLSEIDMFYPKKPFLFVEGFFSPNKPCGSPGTPNFNPVKPCGSPGTPKKKTNREIIGLFFFLFRCRENQNEYPARL